MIIKNTKLSNKKLATGYGILEFNSEGNTYVENEAFGNSLLKLKGYFLVKEETEEVTREPISQPEQAEIQLQDSKEETTQDAVETPAEQEPDHSESEPELPPPSSPDLTREELEEKHYTFIRDYATDRGFNIIGEDGKTISTTKIINLIFGEE